MLYFVEVHVGIAFSIRSSSLTTVLAFLNQDASASHMVSYQMVKHNKLNKIMHVMAFEKDKLKKVNTEQFCIVSFEKPDQKLVLWISSGHPNTLKQ